MEILEVIKGRLKDLYRGVRPPNVNGEKVERRCLLQEVMACPWEEVRFLGIFSFASCNVVHHII